MTVMAPCDIREMQAGLRAALRHDGPVYIRIGKKGEPNIHSADIDLTIGKAIELQTGRDIALLVTGVIMPEALKAAEILSEQGLSVGVTSFPSVKPLDTAYLEDVTKRSKLLVTIEEHGRIGGFGSAVAEWRASRRNGPPLLMIGASDEFLHVIGDQNFARDIYGLTAEKIAASVTKHLG
jgi:transketolase